MVITTLSEYLACLGTSSSKQGARPQKYVVIAVQYKPIMWYINNNINVLVLNKAFFHINSMLMV